MVFSRLIDFLKSLGCLCSVRALDPVQLFRRLGSFEPTVEVPRVGGEAHSLQQNYKMTQKWDQRISLEQK